MEKVRVIVYGTGYIGSGAIRMMSDIDWIEIVGGIDIAKEKVGKDLGEVAGVGKKLGIIVSDDPDAVLAQTKADIVLHTARGTEDEREAQVLKALNAGLNVITVGDNRLMHPWVHWPRLGQRIDEAAKKNGVTVVYGGVTVFNMGLVPLFFTGACESVKKIRIESQLDLGFMADVGEPSVAVFKSYGFGMTVDEFKEVVDRAAADQMHLCSPTGKMVLFPSIDLLADALGWKLDEVKAGPVEPIIAKKGVRLSSGFEVTPGKVCGRKLTNEGIKGGETVITASRIRMIGLKEEGLEEINAVHIEGKPNIDVSYKKGMVGVATWARVVNTIPQVIEARPGLLTGMDLLVATCLK